MNTVFFKKRPTTTFQTVRDCMAKGKKEDTMADLSADPLVQQFVHEEIEMLLKDVELRLLVERMASKYNLSKDKVRKTIVSVIKSSLCSYV